MKKFMINIVGMTNVAVILSYMAKWAGLLTPQCSSLFLQDTFLDVFIVVVFGVNIMACIYAELFLERIDTFKE